VTTNCINIAIREHGNVGKSHLHEWIVHEDSINGINFHSPVSNQLTLIEKITNWQEHELFHEKVTEGKRRDFSPLSREYQLRTIFSHRFLTWRGTTGLQHSGLIGFSRMRILAKMSWHV
jgi:hypothetical protein